MQVSEKSHEIVNKFCKYVETGDKKLIENYSLEELKQAKYQYFRDSDREFYKAIEDRITEFEGANRDTKKKREKWKDRLIGFITAIILIVIGAYLKSCLKLGD